MLHVSEHRVDRARYPVVDAHNHLGRWLSHDGDWIVPDVPAFIAAMDAHNIAVTVNLDGRWGDELERNLDRYDRAHPGRFATFCHVDWTELERSDDAQPLIGSLEQSARAGARGLKVWKDVGLSRRDRAGGLLLPGDKRLRPLWDAAGALRLPVVIHTGDPVAFFEPVDAHNERLEELRHTPSLAISPRLPSFAELLDSLEAAVAGAPNTTFIGAHVGGYPEDLSWVARMLQSYPNFAIDIAGRVAELGRQPRASRRLILEYPDRVLFGSDTPPDQWAVYFRFLETDDEHFPYSTSEVPLHGRWAISGVQLPDDTLQRIYSENARRILQLHRPAPAVETGDPQRAENA